MTKKEMLNEIIENNSGYIKTFDVVKAGISKTYFAQYIQENNLERVAHGIYISENEIIDDEYILQMRYPGAIFSHETAAFYLDYAERIPVKTTITLRAGTGSTVLSKEDIKIYKVKDELFEVGLIEITTLFGNKIRSYNAERTICDFVRSRKYIEYQEFQAVLKAYARSKEKDIQQLIKYAKLFSIEKEVMHYIQILLPG